MKTVASILLLTILVVTSGCTRKLYYKKVSRNLADFNLMVDHIKQSSEFRLNDSIELKDGTILKNFSDKCVYWQSVQDSLILAFMKKYDLNKICFAKRNDRWYDSVISFHKHYAPFFGKAITVSYDFGSSGLRKEIQTNKIKEHRIKIINGSFLYDVDFRPAFGQ